MARPKKHRRIRCNPSSYYFKPRGIPMHSLEEVVVDHDELEALRYADLLKHSHEEAAAKMTVSRATFGRIISGARMKIADGVLNGKAIRINEEKSGTTMINIDTHCRHCGQSWKNRSN